jgi:DNA polymerase (family 10)
VLSGKTAAAPVLTAMNTTAAIPNGTHNMALSRIFRRMAACYRYKGPEHRFRALAYERAARTLSELKEDVSVYAGDSKSLDQLHGIGESIAGKIMEFLNTGRIRAFEKLRREVPQDLLDLMDISGMGPATVKVLYEQLKVSNEEELVKAIAAGRLRVISGFGSKRIDNILRGLKLYKESQSRMLLSSALQTGEQLLAQMKKIKQIENVALAGSLRRKKETIGDIDIIISARAKDCRRIATQILDLPPVGRVLAKGDTKLSFLV